MKPKLFFFLLLIFLALVGYQKYSEYSYLKSIDSYESCVSAKGSMIQESYPATCITRLGSRFVQPTPTPVEQPEMTIISISDIKELFGISPTNWQGATISGNFVWNDLIQVCVDYPIKGSADLCDYFEYWTSNRNGKWQLLGRYSAGEEGPSSCESWENWKVAKGMECSRLSDGYSRQVTF